MPTPSRAYGSTRRRRSHRSWCARPNRTGRPNPNLEAEPEPGDLTLTSPLPYPSLNPNPDPMPNPNPIPNPNPSPSPSPSPSPGVGGLPCLVQRTRSGQGCPLGVRGRDRYDRPLRRRAAGGRPYKTHVILFVRALYLLTYLHAYFLFLSAFSLRRRQENATNAASQERGRTTRHNHTHARHPRVVLGVPSDGIGRGALATHAPIPILPPCARRAALVVGQDPLRPGGPACAAAAACTACRR